MAKRRNKELERAVVRERIVFLFEEAQKRPRYADRYVAIARALAMKLNVRMPRFYQLLFCKHCYRYFRAGETVRTRTRNGVLVQYCLSCKKYSKYRLAKKAAE